MHRPIRLLTLALVLLAAPLAAGCKPGVRLVTRGIVLKQLRDEQRKRPPTVVRGTRPVAVQQRWRAAQGR